MEEGALYDRVERSRNRLVLNTLGGRNLVWPLRVRIQSAFLFM